MLPVVVEEFVHEFKGIDAGTLKSRELKTREWKLRHQIAGVEIAGEGNIWKATVLNIYF